MFRGFAFGNEAPEIVKRYFVLTIRVKGARLLRVPATEGSDFDPLVRTILAH